MYTPGLWEREIPQGTGKIPSRRRSYKCRGREDKKEHVPNIWSALTTNGDKSKRNHFKLIFKVIVHDKTLIFFKGSKPLKGHTKLNNREVVDDCVARYQH